MPEKDGYELVNELWTSGIKWPTIFMTGHTDAIACPSENMPPFEIIRKPFDAAELLDAMARQRHGCLSQQ
jgi:FixJ family two-component response regulator